MKRTIVLAAIAMLLSTPAASAQEWARKMFKVTSHNFGTVARGTTPKFSFKLTNLYEEDVVISGVRSSCGCTTPKLTRRHLKTWETSEVVATFNSRAFSGNRSATITVSISKPFVGEVQLTVKGNIRGDVALEPGTVDFGTLDQGTVVERVVQITHGGNRAWELVDVLSASPHVEVELDERARNGKLVRYDMLVRLKPDAPAGYLQDELTLVTNDREARQLTLPMQANVRSVLTVSPATLYLGVLEPGQTVKKNLVVRGARPFRVLGVDCKDDCFQFQAKVGPARKIHVIPVQFQAGESTGKVVQEIHINTDLGQGATLRCTATATVE